MDTEEPGCIKRIEAWLIDKKREVWNTTLRNQENSPKNIEEYEIILAKLAKDLMNAINTNSIDTMKEKLKNNGWTEDLLECIDDSNIHLEVTDLIEKWFTTFPQVKSSQHMDILEKEKDGLN